MTYSITYYGEHTTTIDGSGKNPTENDLLRVGLQAGLGKTKCKQMIDEVKNCVNEMLEEYL